MIKESLVEKDWFYEWFLKGWRPYVWIILFGFLTYYRTLFWDFTYLDDNQLVIGNYHFIKNLSNIIQTFKEDVFFSSTQAYYRPLLNVSLMLDAAFSGATPSAFVFHAGNIIIHLLASALLFIFLNKLKYPRALSFIFTAMFTIHPILTQAVAWIPGRNDTLFAVFTFASFIWFIKFQEAEKLLHLIIHIIFFTLAIFTKETAVILPVMFFLYLILFARKSPSAITLRCDFQWLGKCFILSYTIKKVIFRRKNLFLIIGWFVPAFVWILLRKIALKNSLGMDYLNIDKAFMDNAPVVLQFLGKVFMPFNLSVMPLVGDTTFIFGILSLILLITALFFSKKIRFNFLFFGLFWFCIFLLPTLLLHNPSTPFGTDYQLEHRMYLPIIGLFIILLEADFIKNLNPKNTKTVVLCGAILFSFSVISMFHSINFKDRIAFWENAAKTSPSSPLAHRNLGAMYYLNGLLNEAETKYRESLEVNPQEPMAHNNLGLIYAKKGMLPEAEEEYMREIEINPNYDNVYYNFGLLRYNQGRPKEAEELWKKTLQLNPNYMDAYKSLAVYYRQQKDQTQAMYYIEQLKKRGVELDPDFLKSMPN